MVSIPNRPEQEIAQIIYSAYEERAAKKGRGIYLSRIGASSLGTPCLRRLFFDWRAYARKVVPGRVQRLFDTGHQQEARVVADLKMAGLQVWDLDPETGKQFTYVDKETGHSVNKIDGVIRGVVGAEKTPHLLEIKTHNDAQWQALNKAMDIKVSHPEHYVQVNDGMRRTGLRRALYVGLNKNDENYYFERVRYDARCAEWGEERIDALYRATTVPEGISKDASAEGCRHCDFKDACLGGQPLKNCRTCRHCEPGPGGEWLCNLHQKVLSWDEQRAACDSWDPMRTEK